MPKGKKKKKCFEELVYSPGFSLFAYTSMISLLYLVGVVLLWREPYLLALVLAGLSALAIFIGSERARDLALYTWVAILGAGSEAICISFGIWTYSAPGIVAGIPFWLPLVWGMGAVFIKRSAVFACFLRKCME
ncbi:MAG: hypothetical protein WC506_01365 [Candidatus Micrarchaeia archaeon]